MEVKSCCKNIKLDVIFSVLFVLKVLPLFPLINLCFLGRLIISPLRD